MNGVSNHRRLDCLLNRLEGQIKKSKLRVSDFCEGNPSLTGGFPSQMANNVENVSIWWGHHVSVECLGPESIVNNAEYHQEAYGLGLCLALLWWHYRFSGDIYPNYLGLFGGTLK